MFEKLANRIVDRQVKIGIIKDSEADIYKYGYLLAFESFANIVIGIVIGLFLNKMPIVILFWCAYIPLRTYSGGWHASSAWLCTILSNITLIWIIFITQQTSIETNPVWHIWVELICIGLIILLSPVGTKAKPISEAEKKVYKRIVVLIIFVEELIGIWIPVFKSMLFWVYLIMLSALLLQLNINIREKADIQYSLDKEKCMEEAYEKNIE